MGFGGNNGLTDFKDILGFNVQAATTRAGLFSASALMLALGVYVTWAIVSSKYGKLLIAVRDAESRTRFLGWRAENVKLFAFTLSAVMAGIAGALYVPQVGIINPGEFEPGNSIEVVIWTAVGGRATIVGPIVGAVLVNTGEVVVHRRAAGILAVCARRPVRGRHAVPAQGHRRAVGPARQFAQRAQGPPRPRASSRAARDDRPRAGKARRVDASRFVRTAAGGVRAP